MSFIDIFQELYGNDKMGQDDNVSKNDDVMENLIQDDIDTGSLKSDRVKKDPLTEDEDRKVQFYEQISFVWNYNLARIESLILKRSFFITVGAKRRQGIVVGKCRGSQTLPQGRKRQAVLKII